MCVGGGGYYAGRGGRNNQGRKIKAKQLGDNCLRPKHLVAVGSATFMSTGQKQCYCLRYQGLIAYRAIMPGPCPQNENEDRENVLSEGTSLFF